MKKFSNIPELNNADDEDASTYVSMADVFALISLTLIIAAYSFKEQDGTQRASPAPAISTVTDPLISTALTLEKIYAQGANGDDSEGLGVSELPGGLILVLLSKDPATSKDTLMIAVADKVPITKPVDAQGTDAALADMLKEFQIASSICLVLGEGNEMPKAEHMLGLFSWFGKNQLDVDSIQILRNQKPK